MSFADLITLMLALFIVLYAASRIDASKAEQIKESLAKTLVKSPPISNQPVAKQIGYDDLLREIQIQLTALGLEGLARVQLVSTGVALTATGDLLFSSGSAEMTPRANDLLNQVASFVLRLPYAIRIEGHTDDIPIHTQQFPSNWELSAARAGRVARFLIERGIAPSRLAVTGYADTRPLPFVVGTSEIERRAANRRVVFLFEKEISVTIPPRR
ncbi:chemotaxis protein MotB [Gammaproteobacteria bacterium]